MDIQLKRGILDICVLSVLLKGESYGYALVRDVSRCVQISESTLYPILKRLENAEMVTVHSSEYNGRLRKYYSITEKGKNKICAFITEWKEMTEIYSFIQENAKEVQHG